ncbi:MAG: LysM peptidoglycan-binding domain-containing protein [Coriobacteriia bacterium]
MNAYRTSFHVNPRRPCTARHHGPPQPAVHPAVAALLVVTAAVLVASFALQPSSPGVSSWATVSVQQGGTLWGIARSHPVPGLSTAETIELIRAQNRLGSSTLYPGQSLRVPGVATDTLAVAHR